MNIDKFLTIEVSGKDPVLWENLQSKFVEAIESILERVIDQEKNSSIKEEAKKFTSALLDYGKQKLYKAGLDNEKIIAEVDLVYGQKQKALAETRKLNAEADSIELGNSMKRLKIALGGLKVIAISKEGTADLIFIKSLDTFLETINETIKNNLLD